MSARHVRSRDQVAQSVGASEDDDTTNASVRLFVEKTNRRGSSSPTAHCAEKQLPQASLKYDLCSHPP